MYKTKVAFEQFFKNAGYEVSVTSQVDSSLGILQQVDVYLYCLPQQRDEFVRFITENPKQGYMTTYSNMVGNHSNVTYLSVKFFNETAKNITEFTKLY